MSDRLLKPNSCVESLIINDLSGKAVFEQRLDGPRMGSGKVSYIADRKPGAKQLNDQSCVHGEILPETPIGDLFAITHRAWLAVDRMLADAKYTDEAFAAIGESRRLL